MTVTAFRSESPEPHQRLEPHRADARGLPTPVMLMGLLLMSACGSETQEPPRPVDITRAELGELLFSDTNLSFNRTQSCATCHNPDRAFVDGRLAADGHISAVSLGDDGVSLGDRNAPTAAYAALIPEAITNGRRERFNRHSRHNLYEGALGGLFWDGRAVGLQGQAMGPPLSSVEMGMPDEASVVARIQENPDYVAAFRWLYGGSIFEDASMAYAAMGDAIAEYEQTEEFSPFDSKYDRFLRGEDSLSFLELSGRALFFSEFTNCSICHQLHNNGDPVNKLAETFTGFEYHNVGVPVNEAARALNGVTGPDLGLAQNPEFDDPSERGKFKVPTLRNVAVTMPYMHNGVFRDLRTVILFYQHSLNPDLHPVNPETGEAWGAPEVEETVAEDLLRVGRPLEDVEVDGLVCFMRTLTDQRYEDLVEDVDPVCAD